MRQKTNNIFIGYTYIIVSTNEKGGLASIDTRSRYATVRYRIPTLECRSASGSVGASWRLMV